MISQAAALPIQVLIPSIVCRKRWTFIRYRLDCRVDQGAPTRLFACTPKRRAPTTSPLSDFDGPGAPQCRQIGFAAFGPQ
jgi:hypothetical protein